MAIFFLAEKITKINVVFSFVKLKLTILKTKTYTIIWHNKIIIYIYNIIY